MLGEAAFTDAWRAGTGQTLECAAAEAMEGGDMLTRREVDQLTRP